MAFQALYAWEASQAPIGDITTFRWIAEDTLARMRIEDLSFTRLLIAGTIENLSAIDDKIKAHLKNWDFSRLKRVDLAILRISVYSLIYQTDIPPSVIIEEAVKICIEYGADDSFRFINGILDAIRKSLSAAPESTDT